MSKFVKYGRNWRWFLVGGLACAGLFQLGGWAGPSLGAPMDPSASPLFDPNPLSDEARYKIPVSTSQPKRGPDDAAVTVVEWCDLSGAACRASDATMLKLRARYGEQLRHVYRHLNEQRTEESVRAHEFTSMAQEHAGKFWEARALLLKDPDGLSWEDVREYTRLLGMEHDSTRSALDQHTFSGGPAGDGLFAARFGVEHGPTYFVNGRRLLGAPTEERLTRMVDIELTHAQEVAASGIPKEQLYEEITKSGLWARADSPMAKAR